MTTATKQSEQVAGRCFFVTGYIKHVAEVGVYDAPSDYDDVTTSQATLIYLCAKDPRMQELAAQVLDLAGTIEDENNLPKARPWFDLAEYLASLA